MAPTPRFTRRSVLAGTALLGAGAVFGLVLPSCRSRGQESLGRKVNSWVIISSDNLVTMRVPQAELGQGATTTLCQLLAEELHLDPLQMHTEPYDPSENLLSNNVFAFTATVGSQAAAQLFDPVRIAGAQIRTLLLQAASRRLGVKADELEAANATIMHRVSGRRLQYSDVAAQAASLPVPAPDKVRLSKPQEWAVIGKSVARRDALEKVTGTAVFGIDIRVAGMKFAAIRQSPVFGGRLASYDATTVRALPGVRAVIAVTGGPSGFNSPPAMGGDDWGMDDAIAVVADSWWQANKGLEALAVRWDAGESTSFDSQELRRQMLYSLGRGGFPFRIEGDVDKGMQAAATVLEGDYEFPFTEHATLEPMNCTAHFANGFLELWAPTQYADEAVRLAARIAQIPVSRVRLHLPFVGGGFGRRLSNDYVSQATQIALQLPGVPVKLIWTREETFRKSYYPAPMVARFKGGVDHEGDLTTLQCTTVTAKKIDQSYAAVRFPQVLENVSVACFTVDSPIPFGLVRGAAFTQYVWMHQGFLDELAHVTGHDPVEFQLRLLDPDRIPDSWTDRDFALARTRSLRAVLSTVASQAAWLSALPPHCGRGVAVADLSYRSGERASAIAAVVEVKLDGNGWLRVTRVVVCIDCGVAINPALVKSLIEGSVGWALSHALYSEITIERGQVVQGNFDHYPVLRIAEMPQVEVNLMPSTEHPTGVGDDAVPVTIAALVNAIYAAGGPRIRSLPVAKHRPIVPR